MRVPCVCVRLAPRSSLLHIIRRPLPPLCISRIIQSIHAMVGLAAIIFLLTNHVLAVVISGGASRLNFKSSAHVWIGRISVRKYLRCLYFCLVSLQLHASRSHLNHSKHEFKSIAVHRFLIFRRVLSYAIFMSADATPDAVAQAVLLAAATCTRALCITYAHASSPALHFQSTATCMSLQSPHPPPPTSSWLDLHQVGRPHIRRHRTLPRRCPPPPPTPSTSTMHSLHFPTRHPSTGACALGMTLTIIISLLQRARARSAKPAPAVSAKKNS